MFLFVQGSNFLGDSCLPVEGIIQYNTYQTVQWNHDSLILRSNPNTSLSKTEIRLSKTTICSEIKTFRKWSWDQIPILWNRAIPFTKADFFFSCSLLFELHQPDESSRLIPLLSTSGLLAAPPRVLLKEKIILLFLLPEGERNSRQTYNLPMFRSGLYYFVGIKGATMNGVHSHTSFQIYGI